MVLPLLPLARTALLEKGLRNSPLAKLVVRLKVLFGRLLARHRRTSLIFIGMINGLLPCGLSFLALSYTITLVGALDGFNFMLLFGAGTLPALLGFGSIIKGAAGWLSTRLSLPVLRVQTIALIALGCFLMLRVWLGHARYPANIRVGGFTEVVCE
ncbi:MAG: sulfite exporter TauE/SafE family protein [Bacteroidia bacterium]|nr:sulfite exporter TauE/SafE family protein [Bacteroidia bacterium]